MPKISDSSGVKIDLKENVNATLWRRVAATDLTDLVGYTVFVRLLPRHADPIEVVDVTVVDNTFEFEFDTTGMAAKTDYVAGWTDPAGRIEVVMYGQVVLV